MGVRQRIGPRESSVGFAILNGYVHNLIGVNMSLYTITDWLGIVPIAVALGFAILGLKYKLTKEDVERMSAEVLGRHS